MDIFFHIEADHFYLQELRCCICIHMFLKSHQIDMQLGCVDLLKGHGLVDRAMVAEW